MLREVEGALARAGSQKRARIMQRFFRTGQGEYGEGDVFLGVSVPEQRKIARQYQDLSYPEIRTLLFSPVHEHRLTGLLLLVQAYRSGDERVKRGIFELYLEHRDRVNNWDLVDVTAPSIVGDYLLKHPEQRHILGTLARSESLWDRRIAIVSTLAFIRQGHVEEAVRIAALLLKDGHDLIHKAVGWMLREVGKRQPMALDRFLGQHAAAMPRTMLRAAVERLPAEKRLGFIGKRRATSSFS